VPDNPTTNGVDTNGRVLVENERAAHWCRLFDLRYRMLLFRLKHAFFVRAGDATDVPTERGNLIAWTFGEMYNLRAISGIVIQFPLKEPDDGRFAAPPFEMPYTLSMPDWDSDKWRVHRDLIANSRKLTQTIRELGDTQTDFLNALDDNDELADVIAAALLRRALEREAV
jgi:hypothetical protein